MGWVMSAGQRKAALTNPQIGFLRQLATAEWRRPTPPIWSDYLQTHADDVTIRLPRPSHACWDAIGYASPGSSHVFRALLAWSSVKLTLAGFGERITTQAWCARQGWLGMARDFLMREVCSAWWASCMHWRWFQRPHAS